MRKLLRVAGMFCVAELCAGALPPAPPITTAAELRAAASDAPVARIDFMVPDSQSAAEDALSKRFFNQPEEHRYSGMTSADWRAKWQLFSDSLVGRAKEQSFDSESLDACLRALNRGRNRQTMLEPRLPEQGLIVPESSTKEIEAQKRDQEKQRREYAEAIEQREKHPEQFYNDSLAIVPVGAYLGRHAQGECWIIVCKWEMVVKEGPSQLGHIMVWAMDTRTTAVVGYVTCD